MLSIAPSDIWPRNSRASFVAASAASSSSSPPGATSRGTAKADVVAARSPPVAPWWRPPLRAGLHTHLRDTGGPPGEAA
eukprot:CAMPEP_0118961560 /NCGR_PEP_ID=MMETSP1173-20130426/201_1 /TAXON_ID=1034831 /ORGANISM="Rhizochromulina marina cf, Strain CCMP1243" /LENGTH=78 /DNA_ID=CAMNT_0006909737 /DNA_START=456 /DNA_END=689 /DNA_ORIENTATION=-